MSDTGNGQHLAQRIVIESDGSHLRLAGNVSYDVMEGVLARALGHIQREILLARFAQASALAHEQAPRIHLPGGPMI